MVSRDIDMTDRQVFDGLIGPMSTTEATNLLYAVIDIGSNGIRFSISDLSSPSARLLKCIYRERASISLHDALQKSTSDETPTCFSAKIINKVTQTLTRFKNICANYRVPDDQITAFATEALRVAENQDELLRSIQQATGLTVSILSPQAESLLGSMGARATFHDVDGIFMDLGGGSLQMTYMSSSEQNYQIAAAACAKSLPYGAAKLTALMAEDGSSQATITKLRLGLKKCYQDLRAEFPSLARQEDGVGTRLYLYGGGFRGYGSMLMEIDESRPYSIPLIQGYSSSGACFSQWHIPLGFNTNPGVFGVSKRRRKQFPAVVEVVKAIVEVVPAISDVIFCGGGNREGLLYMRLPETTKTLHPAICAIANAISNGNSMMSEGHNRVRALLLTAQPLRTLDPKLKQAEGEQSMHLDVMLHYLAARAWLGLGDTDTVNTARALQDPISGSLAGLIGFTHDMRARLALALCARWSSELSPFDRSRHRKLQRLVGLSASFWCDYFGTVARLLSTLVTGSDIDAIAAALEDAVRLTATMSTQNNADPPLLRIELHIKVRRQALQGLKVSKLSKMFDKVGQDEHRSPHTSRHRAYAKISIVEGEASF